MDFMVNFGVTAKTKAIFTQILESCGSFAEFQDAMSAVPDRELFFGFKYFNWADKKLHHVSYTENKDDISEDLLSDFFEEDKVVNPKVLARNKAGVIDTENMTKMIVSQPKLVSETEFIMGGGAGRPKKGAVDITSAEDFPTLGGMGAASSK